VGLSVTVLGCSGSYPGPGEACSGYLVRGAGTTVWLDAGSGTLANLQLHVGLHDVDAVVISHEHPDHWSDLEGYWVAMTYGEEPGRHIPVFAPAGLRDRTTTEMEPTFDWRIVADGAEVAIGGLGLRFSRTDHRPETLAVRIDGDGRSFGYSADTGPDWSLSALGAGLDLALCEASYTSDKPGDPRHLTAAEAGRSGREAGVGRLLLTHFWPTVDRKRSAEEAAAAFGKPVEIATTNEEYHL
jgi:ribonuclease BN (tRNA processing enzyme)